MTDIDGDLDPDIVAYERYCWRIVWWENDGEGNFSRTREWNPPLDDPENWYQAISLNDFNGDGISDAFYLRNSLTAKGYKRISSFHVALADGNGSFELSEALVSEFQEEDDHIDYPIRDFDGNGTPDLILEEAVYLSDTIGNFSDRISLDFSIGEEDRLTDWDNDGDLDVISEKYDWSLGQSVFKIRINQGAGVFSEEVLLLHPNRISFYDRIKDQSGSYSSGLLVFPETEEGKHLEVHAVTGGGSVEVVASLNIEDLPEFEEWVGINLFSGPNDRLFLYTRDLFIDVGDKETDLFEVRWNEDAIEVEEISTGHPNLLIPSEVLIADLDQDGLSDLLVTVQGNDRTIGQVEDHLFWFRTESEGEYEEERFITQPAWVLEVSFAEDINNDGKVDVIGYQSDEAGSSQADLTIWRNQDHGTTFESERVGSSVSSYQVFDIVDVTTENFGRHLNHSAPEGFKDFFVTENLWVNEDYGANVRMLLQDEEGDFSPLLLFQETGWIKQIYRVDWDGDGLKDLVYVIAGGTSWRAHDFLYWRRCLNGVGAFGGGLSLLDLEGFHLVGAPEDFDDDGDLDLPLSLKWIPAPGQIAWGVNGGNHRIEALEIRSETKVVEIQKKYSSDRWTQLDLDSDGDLDLIRRGFKYRRGDFSTIEWFERKGPEQFSPVSGIHDASPLEGNPIGNVRAVNRNSLVMGDIDGDGVDDLVVGSNERLEWFKVSQTPQPEKYKAWALENSLLGHSAAPGADWDGDFYSNWAEFAFGSDPLIVDPSHPGKPRVHIGPTGLALVFQRRTNADTEELSYQSWISQDLGIWSAWEPISPMVSPLDGDYESVSFPVDVALKKAFFKVEPSMPTGE